MTRDIPGALMTGLPVLCFSPMTLILGYISYDCVRYGLTNSDGPHIAAGVGCGLVALLCGGAVVELTQEIRYCLKDIDPLVRDEHYI